MKEQILEKLKSVKYPGFEKDIVSFNFVKDVKVENNEALINIEIASSNPEVSNEIRKNINEVLSALNLKNIEINIITPKIPEEKSNSRSGKNIVPQVKNFIMISSGKGGVGKSTTTVNLAISMAKMGKKVGILDADIYGPNIPRMLGETKTQPEVVGQRLKPILTHGIYMMSMGVLIEEGQGLMWRGAMIMKAMEQLLADVIWPELDVLFLDMPPGTGDAQITSAQSIPITAGVCVSTPQTVSLDDSKRALDMFNKLHIPIAGIVENMSGFLCPDNGKEYDIFGKGTTEEMAKAYKSEVLAQIPIEMIVREGGDEGKPVSFYHPESVSSKRYLMAAEKIWNFIEKINNEGGADNSAIQPIMNGKSACSH
ncbi:Mrp/NBP35 family ATP-binding protein [Campylobacter molothri]|uniref:Mrp/NBP35 family ATP-binding protein n=1 Tax=Campylobacter molothri TaxID=1032242 RepID=UPI001908A3B5|nr:Mrp/NBP35 family ATP-binding protein [Campylobacter sp. 2018MI35]MBZ7928154.1 Mrp/NBP35 family ATP-binding protein [Campylobacter sp. RM10542]MBZ7930904.1 Mrp/NBP35 family ATP-binding protein [Campylobacter sp. RM12910]MBZ7943636.1 Mrp/NBP35 family ATP-binding protein [Campylobacter sp. RM13744]MBZ7946580.1 Mrp/NBP35 family ATP-binding protein [Campylobacter sp. RM10536]MBZ7952028.1 Mrp/NBP35 family ATP-binding protein [Campylobacter sp. RM9939]MBZ7956487.1 Mrp/NBP35 family ATP-binding pro